MNGDNEHHDEDEAKPADAVKSEEDQDRKIDSKPSVNGDAAAIPAESPKRPEVTGPVLRIRLDDHVADVTLEDMAVHSPHDNLKRRVESVLQVASRTITPLAPIHPKSSWVAKGGSKRISVKPEA